jgi:hypothetical protein
VRGACFLFLSPLLYSSMTERASLTSVYLLVDIPCEDTQKDLRHLRGERPARGSRAADEGGGVGLVLNLRLADAGEVHGVDCLGYLH